MWKILLSVVLLAALFPYVYRYMKYMRYHVTDVSNLHPGICTRVPGVENGSEDVELLPGGKLLISSGARHSYDTPVRGRVLLVDLNQSELKAVEVPIRSDLGFNFDTFIPGGMAKWFDAENGKFVIFITNYNLVSTKGTVEKFHFSEEETILYHLETIGKDDPNFFMVNDIAPVSHNQFYYTNFLRKYPSWEFAYTLPWGDAGFYDGHSSTITDKGLAGPNGIGLSPNGKYVYMNVYLGMFMRIYERLPDNSLQHLQDFTLPMSGDNLMVDDNGDIWNAGHVSGWTVMKSMSDNSIPVPSQVIRMTMKDGEVASWHDVFKDDGELHSLGSVALPYKDKLFLGSVDREAVVCDMNKHD